MTISTLLAACALLCTSAMCAANTDMRSDERAVRELISRRNMTYRDLNAEALAALLTPDFRLVDRLGDNYRSTGPDFNRRMWDWGFRHVYNGRPGPEHRIINLEFIAPTVALVQTSADWEEIVLDNGMRIPPHGEVDTFIVVKRSGQWQIKMQTIHNRASDRIGDDFDFVSEPKGMIGARVR